MKTISVQSKIHYTSCDKSEHITSNIYANNELQ